MKKSNLERTRLNEVTYFLHKTRIRIARVRASPCPYRVAIHPAILREVHSFQRCRKWDERPEPSDVVQPTPVHIRRVVEGAGNGVLDDAIAVGVKRCQEESGEEQQNEETTPDGLSLLQCGGDVGWCATTTAVVAKEWLHRFFRRDLENKSYE